MTLRQLGDELTARGIELGKDALYKLAPKIPGATKQALRPGAIPQWTFPDDTLDRLTPDLIEEAVAEARSSPPPSSAASAPAAAAARVGVGDDEAELRRARLRLDRERLELDRLEVEGRRAELERRRGGASAGGVDATTLLLLDRLNSVERKLDGAGGHTSGFAALAAAIGPVLTPLITQFAARPGVGELLGLLTKAQPDPLAIARQLRELGVGGAQDPAGAVARARELLEVVTMLRPLIGRGREESSFWSEIGRAIAPEIPGVINRVAGAVETAARSRVQVEQIRRGAAPAPTAVPPAIVQFQQELEQAARQHLVGFFPTLRQRILELWPEGGAELLAAVTADPAADAMAMERLGQAGIQLTPAIQTFLRTFANWCRYVARQQAGAGAAPAATNGAGGPVRARCDRCRAEFQLDDEAQWLADTKVCDQKTAGGVLCGGVLVRSEAGQDEARR